MDEASRGTRKRSILFTSKRRRGLQFLVMPTKADRHRRHIAPYFDVVRIILHVLTCPHERLLARLRQSFRQGTLNLQSLDPGLPNDRRTQIVTELCEASARFEQFWL